MCRYLIIRAIASNFTSKVGLVETIEPRQQKQLTSFKTHKANKIPATFNLMNGGEGGHVILY